MSNDIDVIKERLKKANELLSNIIKQIEYCDGTAQLDTDEILKFINNADIDVRTSDDN